MRGINKEFAKLMLESQIPRFFHRNIQGMNLPAELVWKIPFPMWF